MSTTTTTMPLQVFRLMAAIVSEKSTVSLFPIEKPSKFPNLTLPQNRSRSLHGHHLNKL